MQFLPLLLVAQIAGAQQAGEERDPFYPSERVPAAPVSRQDADWGADPFSNPFAGKGASVQPDQRQPERVINLTGIIFSKGVRLAIFGGETLREGSMLGEQKVVAIRKRSVVLRSANGGSEEIFLNEFSLRK